MLLVGLTGGIGSGKSSVSSRLAERGAQVVDADAIVRELQRSGEAVFEAMVEHFGPGIVADDGELDRAAVGAIVFSDEEQLRALEALVHPVVRAETDDRIARLAKTDAVVVLDIPLLAESRRDGGTGPDGRGASAIVVVDCPVETAIDRLVAHRGFDEDDARRRVAAQASREERLALADFVIDNSGTTDELDAEVERCWSWLADLPPTPWPPPPQDRR